MSLKKEISVFSTVVNRIKKIVFFFIKIFYLLPFIVFGLWLVSTVYFHGFHLETRAKEVTGEEVIDIIMRKKEPIPRDHFHMTDKYIERQQPNQPVCVVCHGTYAHNKEKRVRSMLNLHTGFIACYVCHARQDLDNEEAGTVIDRHEVEFLWVDWNTGEFSNAVKGEYGKYPAEIYPVELNKDGRRRIFTPIKAADAQQFLKMLPELTPDQVSKAKAKLHEPLSKKPVFCSDCHKQNGYLDYEKLGFPRQRIDNLVSSEIVGMIDKYKTFYLPSVIDFRGN